MTEAKTMPALNYILDNLLREFAAKFAANNKEYGDMHQELGIRAQYVDMHRKMGKVRRALWDGVDTNAWREGPREILMDLIGHCFLTIQLMDSGEIFQQPEREREDAFDIKLDDNPILSSVVARTSAPREWFRDQADQQSEYKHPAGKQEARLGQIEEGR